MDMKKALEEIMSISALGNKYFQEKEPWKNPDEKVLGLCVNIVRNLSILVYPMMPNFSEKLWKQLGCADLKWKDISFEWKGKILDVEPLIKKLE